MNKTCHLCKADALLVIADMRGYVEGTTFRIYECKKCKVAFSDPLRSDDFVYDTFYRHASLVPGYERYGRYEQLVKQVRNPLRALTTAEPIYWSAYEALKANSVSKGSKVLEVGSGLGYFVHALRTAGFEATGIDISSEAVDRATASYGPYFRTEDIFTFTIRNAGLYDCVFMLETIEHVENPEEFIRAGLGMLKENGVLIITTPNKDQFSASPWSMDPPVHLWSFSEASLRQIAKAMGKPVSFVDFTEYTKRFFTYVTHYVDGSSVAIRPYRITKSGSLSPWFRVGAVKSRLFSVKVRHLLSTLFRRLRTKKVSAQIPTLCAMIRNESKEMT